MSRTLIDRPLARSTVLSVVVHAAAIAVLLAGVPPPAAPPVLVELVVFAPEGSAPTTPPDIRPVARKSVDAAPHGAAPIRPATRTEHAPESRPVERREAESVGAVPAPRPPAPAQPSGSVSDEPAPGPSAPPTIEATELLQAEMRQHSAATNVEPAPSSDSKASPATPWADEPRADAHGPGAPGSHTARAAPAPGPAVFSAPRLEHKGKPRYPEAARAAGIEGTVIIRVHVLASGEVAAAEVSRSAGYAVLDRAAIDSIRAVRFAPGRRGAEPVAMWVEVPVQFRLER